MKVSVAAATPLRFADGSPVRAASAIAPYGDGWLVAQDDATHGCWLRPGPSSGPNSGSDTGAGIGTGTPVRLLPAVDGHEVFAEAAGTKRLKPDLEAACAVPGGVLLLGSGSTPARMRAVLLRHDDPAPPVVADLAPLYAAVAAALEVPPDELNLEGACVIGDRLRWFHRGRPAAGLPSASVDLDLTAVLGLVLAQRTPAPATPVAGVRRYDLGRVDGIGLAVTDAVSLGDGLVLVSAAAEDTPNAYDDGPVVGSAVALLDDDTVLAVARLPDHAGGAPKVEGLAVEAWSARGGRVLATVDQDDPTVPSVLLSLDVRR